MKNKFLNLISMFASGLALGALSRVLDIFLVFQENRTLDF